MSIFSNAASAAAVLRNRVHRTSNKATEAPARQHADSLHAAADHELAMSAGAPAQDDREGHGTDGPPRGHGALIVAMALLLGLVALVALNMK